MCSHSNKCLTTAHSRIIDIDKKLSCRREAAPRYGRVVENFTKSLKVTRGYSKLHH